tara:strand:- start:1069 stop:1701 length:633 start_codon:yes stop_codon:yes gene_type:complete
MTQEPISHISAFAIAQASVGTAFKNATNPFLKNTYADLSAIQNAVFPSFHANGFAIIQTCGADEFGRYLKTEFLHITGGRFEGKIYLEYKQNDMQSLGAAITYARRYGLSSMSGVPVEDDDGNAASGVTAPKRGSTEPKKAEPPANTPDEEKMSRGMNMMRYLETADAASLEATHEQCMKVIQGVRSIDVPFSERMIEALQMRKLALETK